MQNPLKTNYYIHNKLKAVSKTLKSLKTNEIDTKLQRKEERKLYALRKYTLSFYKNKSHCNVGKEF